MLIIWYCLNILYYFLLGRNVKEKEKARVTHSSTLAWKLPWMEEPGRLQSMGSQRVGCDWVTSLSLFTFMHWIRKWQPAPVFLPGESQGRGSLVGCHLRGCTQSDTTDVTKQLSSSRNVKGLERNYISSFLFSTKQWSKAKCWAFKSLSISALTCRNGWILVTYWLYAKSESIK